MVEQEENEIYSKEFGDTIIITVSEDDVNIWSKDYNNRSANVDMSKTNAIELFTRALKLLQDEKDI
jgi:hypothetical protein